MRPQYKILITLFLFALLTACNKPSSEIDYNPNVLSSKDFVRAEDAIMEIVNAFYKGIHDTLLLSNGYSYIDDCGVSLNSQGDLMTYSYGPVDRYCQDGKFRRGEYRVELTGPIFDEGVFAYFTTDSLFVDDLPVEAAIEIQSLGLNNENLPYYSLKVTSSKILLDTLKKNGVNLLIDYSLVWKEGSETPAIHEDDMYLITGTASGVSSDSYEFSIAVQEPLWNYLDCWWIAKGISQITVPSAKFTTGVIDYIDADGCNNAINYYFNDNLFYDIIK